LYVSYINSATLHARKWAALGTAFGARSTSCRREAATICPRLVCDLDLRPSDLESCVRVTCKVGYLCAKFSLPRPLCFPLRPDVHETDVRQHHRLMPPRRGHNNNPTSMDQVLEVSEATLAARSDGESVHDSSASKRSDVGGNRAPACAPRQSPGRHTSPSPGSALSPRHRNGFSTFGGRHPCPDRVPRFQRPPPCRPHSTRRSSTSDPRDVAATEGADAPR